MTRPLHKDAARDPEERPTDGHAGLWFDKFCDKWNNQGFSWTMGSKKLEWIDTVTDGKVGTKEQIDEFAMRMAILVDMHGGRFSVFTSESRFVTGLGRSHPVENGFVWHPTLGTPYLPGSSIKGAVRAWTKRDADPPIPCETVNRLLGDAMGAGGVCFLDAVPIAPVQLESDIMTPHYAGWPEEDPPGDWCSPTPIPFLVTGAGTSFLFGFLSRGTVSNDDLDAVMSWVRSAFAWCGGGAKTAVGYGRFARDDARTRELRQRLEAREAAERKARLAEIRLAEMHPVHREIEEILEARPNKNEPEVTTIIRNVREGRWSGSDRTEVARWLEGRMKAEKRWKENSDAKNPSKDKAYQRTLLVRGWLDEEQESRRIR